MDARPTSVVPSAAKGALNSATKSLAREVASRGITVNAVAPGYVLPAPGQSEADFKRLHGETPLGEGPTPGDIAHAVPLTPARSRPRPSPSKSVCTTASITSVRLRPTLSADWPNFCTWESSLSAVKAATATSAQLADTSRVRVG